ncbi:Crp/Fnr family transcriptional regulator [Novosphingobium sp.]|uniref:Crp/Fnr family transcriptional regulator n=1 Tax=Novosphingobium sp. TaxID=1874826 RepID=UPI0025FAC4E0|nr:Crp/Fnr family transcriptional regulator [Novosphingobium sp.]
MATGVSRHAGALHALQAIAEAFACDGDLAATIEAFAHETAHPRGAVLWPLADRDETTLIMAGSAQEVAYGQDGSVLQLMILGQGDLYGSLMGADESGAAQTEAVSEGRGAHFTTASLVRLMDSYSAVARAINRQLASRLEALRRRMVESTLLSVSGRISAELLRRSAFSPDRTIRPMPVMSELALSVRSTRETVSRTISQLEKRGLVRRVEGGLQVVAPHRLQEIVY